MIGASLSTSTTHVGKGESASQAIQESNPNKKKCKKKTLYVKSTEDVPEEFFYNNLAETGRAEIDDGNVEFTKQFLYVGSFFSYCLKDDYDICQRISKDLRIWVYWRIYGKVPS